MTSGLRPMIDAAVAAAIAEHPKYFTPKGLEHARTAIVRKVMAALRGDNAEKSADELAPEPAAPMPLVVDPKSREGRAYANLRKLAGAPPPFRMGNGTISIPPQAQRESVYAFSDLPAESAWLFVTVPRQIAAWMEFFGETLAPAPRRTIQHVREGESGILVPWPWPPSATGKTYTGEAA